MLLVVALLALNQYTSSRVAAKTWKETDINCLPNGHENLTQHIHAILTLYVDGEVQGIPAGIGLSPSCMAEIHTHDATGKIHVESRSNRQFTLGEFFEVAGMPLSRDAYHLTVTVDGTVIEDPASLILADDQNIEVRYDRY